MKLFLYLKPSLNRKLFKKYNKPLDSAFPGRWDICCQGRINGLLNRSFLIFRIRNRQETQ